MNSKIAFRSKNSSRGKLPVVLKAILPLEANNKLFFDLVTVLSSLQERFLFTVHKVNLQIFIIIINIAIIYKIFSKSVFQFRIVNVFLSYYFCCDLYCTFCIFLFHFCLHLYEWHNDTSKFSQKEAKKRNNK